MTKATIDNRTPAQLREAIRSGDTTISAEMLAAAEHRAEHEALLAEAAELQAAATAEAERQAAIDELKRDIEASAADVQKMRELAGRAIDALAELIGLARARRAELAEFAARAKSLNIQENDALGNWRHPAGIDWRRRAGDGVSIKVGDRSFSPPNPWHLIARVVSDARARVKLSESQPGTRNKPMPATIDEQLDLLDHVPPPKPAPVAIEWIPSRAGRTGRVLLSPSEAHHYVNRGLARYA